MSRLGEADVKVNLARNAKCGMRNVKQEYTAARTSHAASQQGQSTTEYALLIAAVVAAFLGIWMYVQRGFQGRLRQAATSIGPLYGPGLIQDSQEALNLTRTSHQDIKLEGEGASRTSIVTATSNSTAIRTRTETFTDDVGRDLFD